MSENYPAGQKGKSYTCALVFFFVIFLLIWFQLLAISLYLKDQKNKSYVGFLKKHCDLIVSSSDNWNNLNDKNTWFTCFLDEAKKIDENNFADFSNKVCFFILQSENNPW